MGIKKYTLAVLAYAVVSFVLGFTWHLILFKDAYQSFGVYTREPPIFAFGVGSMVLQGLILAYLYPFFNQGSRPVLTGVRFGLLMGAFMWSVTVLAFAAKITVNPLGTFLVLSTLFHLIQFIAAGALIGWIYRRVPER
jgi:hypothetical protein